MLEVVPVMEELVMVSLLLELVCEELVLHVPVVLGATCALHVRHLV